MNLNYKIFRGKFEIPDERDFLSKIREIAEYSSVFIILFDSKAVAGCSHIKTALTLAERSFFEYKTPVSNFFEMEVLLYAIGTRQTGFASGFGIHKGSNDSLIVICRRKNEESEELEEQKIISFNSAVDNSASAIANLDESIENISIVNEENCMNFSMKKTGQEISCLMDIFSITAEEIEICGKDKIEEIVCERCALLDVSK